jgi:thiamine kinase-like enzyme
MTEETIQEYIYSLPPRLFGLHNYKALHCKRLMKGLHHINFKLSISDDTTTCQAVLRLPATAENQQALMHEAWYLEKLRDDLAPKLLFHADTSSLGVPVLITEFVSGTHISFSELDDTQIAMLAEKLVDIHAIKDDRYSVGTTALPTTTGTYRDYAKLTILENIDKPYEQALAISHDREVISQARRLLQQKITPNDESWNQNKFSLCHGDIGIYNILWEEHDLRLIDWDGARFGDPADDIAYIFAINNVSARWQGTFLDTYIRKSARDDISSRIDMYLLKNYLFDVVWAMDKLLEEQEDRSLIKLARGEYGTEYEKRVVALKQHLSRLA